MLVGPIPLRFMSLRLMPLRLVSLGFMPLAFITLMFMWIRPMLNNSCDSIKWCSTMYLVFEFWILVGFDHNEEIGDCLKGESFGK